MTERILRVEAPHFVAGAVWLDGDVGWACVEAAPIISWMWGKPSAEVQRYLNRKGWTYSWLPDYHRDP